MRGMPVAGGRILLFVIVLIWGATFPVLKALVASLPPALLAGMRFTMGALGLRVALGLFYLALPATTFALAGQLYGQRFVPAAEAAVIFALEPVFGAAFAFLFLGERLTLLNLTGAAAMCQFSDGFAARTRQGSAARHIPRSSMITWLTRMSMGVTWCSAATTR